MGRELDVRVALKEALLATHKFGEAVFLSGLPEDFGFGSSNLAAAAIEPGGSQYATGWEAVAWLGGLAYDAICTVTLLARHEDPQLRDELAESLLDVLSGIVGGDTLARDAVPGRTGIVRWEWLPPDSVERRIQATVGFAFMSAGAGTGGGDSTSVNPFPLHDTHRLWDLLCETLLGDSILSGAIKTWQLWRGDASDTLFDSLTTANLPALRLTPLAAPGGWRDNVSHEFKWPIRVDLDIPGFDARVAMDGWEEFARVLFPGNNVLLNQMILLGAHDKTLTTPAYEPRRYTDGRGYRASGILTVTKRIES